MKKNRDEVDEINDRLIDGLADAIEPSSRQSYVKHIALAKGKTIDNCDFVIRYQLAGKNTQSGFLTHQGEQGNYFSLLIEPPAIPAANDITPREIVFVLDTSGSMGGEPLDASKHFMQYALKGLRKNDFFRVIRFGNNASEFTESPVAATPSNIRQGLDYVNALRANGGSEIRAGIQQAFSIPQQDNTIRLVVFLTDGYIGNESEILSLIAEKKTRCKDLRVWCWHIG